MMELLLEPEPKPRSPVSARGTIVAPQDLDAACAMPSSGTEQTIASIAPDDPKQMLVELVGNEQVSQ